MFKKIENEKEGKEKMKEKTNQGITLIALVVTIIILLLLASISISVVLGNNGLIEMVKKATDEHKEIEENEDKVFENLLEQIESQTGTSGNGELTITMTTNTPQQGDKYKLSEAIVYEIVVENTGDIAITDIEVLEELTGKLWEIEYLEPEESKTYKVDHIVTEEDILKGKINNKVTATGTYIGTEETEIKAEVTIENKIEPPNAHLNILIGEESTPANGATYSLGESITYSITVKNDGNLTITNIAVTDELTGDEWSIETLAPGGSKTLTPTAKYVVTEDDALAGSVLNVAIAEGQANGVEWVEVNSGVSRVPVQYHEPSLFVRCTVSDSGKSYKLGETVNCDIEVINNGNATIKDITISDPLTGNEFSIESLEPNGKQTFTSEYTITEDDILQGSAYGIYTATGTDSNGDDVSDEDEYRILTEEINSHLKVKVVPTSRPANGRRYELLETITYSITVTNDGNLALMDITVECELTGDAWTIEYLAPGESETYTAEYWVTEAEVSAGKVDNRVVVTAMSPDPDNPEVGAEGSCTENLN